MKINFDGYAIGGLAVGETQNEMFSVLDNLKEELTFRKTSLFNGCWNTIRYLRSSKKRY